MVFSELEKKKSRNYKKKGVKTLNKVKEEIRFSHIWGKLLKTDWLRNLALFQIHF